MCKRVLVIATVCWPWWVIGVDLNTRDKAFLLPTRKKDHLTLVGVIGYVGRISFLSGRLPRCKVTLDGGFASALALTAPLGMSVVDIVNEASETKKRTSYVEK